MLSYSDRAPILKFNIYQSNIFVTCADEQRPVRHKKNVFYGISMIYHYARAICLS